jgi:hypothetical protein
MSAIEKLRQNGISVEEESLRAIAQKFSVKEISVFGSSVRGHVRADSDIDLLVSFAPDAEISLFDLMDLEEELSQLLGRAVDLVEAESLTNPIRRRAILSSVEPLYAA